MSHIPKSFHFDDLQPPIGEFHPKIRIAEEDHWLYGRVYELATFTELRFRDLVEYDGVIHMVGRTLIDHVTFTRCWLIERERLLEIIAKAYGEATYQPRTHSIPSGG